MNNVLWSVIIAAFIAQSIKIFLKMKKDKKGLTLNDFIVTGGMPSTHSAASASLFAIFLFESGLSNITIFALVFFLIVVTDAMGVRRTAGEEAQKINKIIKLEKLKLSPVHYALGHKPIDVLVGILIGFFVAIIIFIA